VTASAALQGAYGLQAVIDDNNSLYVVDESPATELRYRVRFSFDPNSTRMASGNSLVIFQGESGSAGVLRVELRYNNGTYQARAGLLNDGSTWRNSGYIQLSDTSHTLELDWKASSTASANNGYLTLWVDGSQRANLTGVDNDTRRIDRARLGAVSGVDTGTRGAYLFDSFESRRLTYIGP